MPGGFSEVGRGYPRLLWRGEPRNPGTQESGSATPNYPVSGSPRPPPSALWLGAGVGKGARRVETRNGSPQLSIAAFGGGDGWLELRVKFGDYLWFPDDLFNTALGS